jgi:hypothetical protein
VKGVEPGELPIRWTADGRSILVRPGAPTRRDIDRIDLGPDARTRWKTFEPADPAGVDAGRAGGRLADEKTCVFSYRRVLGELYSRPG